MTDCDASVVALQSAILFGLMDIAAVGCVLGGERISFRALDGLCLLTDWAALFSERSSTLSHSAMERKREGGAMGIAARCDG